MKTAEEIKDFITKKYFSYLGLIHIMEEGRFHQAARYLSLIKENYQEILDFIDSEKIE